MNSISLQETLAIYASLLTKGCWSNEKHCEEVTKLFPIPRKPNLCECSSQTELREENVVEVDAGILDGLSGVYEHTLHQGCDANSGRTERAKQHLAKEKEIKLYTLNTLDESRQMSIDYMNENDDIKGFTLNTKLKRPWFHKEIQQKKIKHAVDHPDQNKIKWHELHIK
jgi:hypothetical protein